MKGACDIWPPYKIEQLRTLWAQNLTANQIAKIMDISRNAVLGKRKRLGLPERPHCVKRQAKLRGLAALKKAQEEMEKMQVVKVDVKKQPAPKPVVCGVVRECLWPFGDPLKPDFHFCNAPTMPERSYCEEHMRKAYVSVPKRKKDHDNG